MKDFLEDPEIFLIKNLLCSRSVELENVFSKTFHHLPSTNSALCRGQSRLTNITDNEGCVRYPTEGNNSSHELTTAMHHLTNCLAATIVSYCLQLV